MLFGMPKYYVRSPECQSQLHFAFQLPVNAIGGSGSSSNTCSCPLRRDLGRVPGSWFWECMWLGKAAVFWQPSVTAVGRSNLTPNSLHSSVGHVLTAPTCYYPQDSEDCWLTAQAIPSSTNWQLHAIVCKPQGSLAGHMTAQPTYMQGPFCLYPNSEHNLSLPVPLRFLHVQQQVPRSLNNFHITKSISSTMLWPRV